MPPKKTKAIMLQGTGSGVGKSIMTAALCRYFYKKGVRVAPFKAQNMALNSFVTLDGLEMGRAQVYQAEACGLEPDVRMNPILLKPNADNHSQVILMGKAKGNKKAREYYRDFDEHWRIVRGAYASLASEYDLIIIEGAGSPAEINLQKTDLVNMKMARYAGASVLIIGDIDRGGVFAWMKGTFDLLQDEYKSLVKGFIINKFRGDQTLLEPGIRMFEEMVGRPVLGVVPYQSETWIDEEDSLPRCFTEASHETEHVRIGVVILPRISNFTDFAPLALEKDVALQFLKTPREVEQCDGLIIPGSKSTISDTQYLCQEGWFDRIRNFRKKGGCVVGVCGGYQMLGQTISDPSGVEGDIRETDGLGLLPIKTEIKSEKVLKRVNHMLLKQDFLAGGKGREPIHITGYEIHMGSAEIIGRVVPMLETEDPTLFIASEDYNVLGSYIHGLFDSDTFRRNFINMLRKKKGLAPVRFGLAYREYREAQLDKLAEIAEKRLDMESIKPYLY